MKNIIIILILFSICVNIFGSGNNEPLPMRTLIISITEKEIEIRCQEFYIGRRESWGEWTYFIICYTKKGVIVFEGASKNYIYAYWKEE